MNFTFRARFGDNATKDIFGMARKFFISANDVKILAIVVGIERFGRNRFF
jgi:hypothetical protein